MLFHEKLDVKLLRLVKENPVLYDSNHLKYMDFNAREVAWQKIGDELKRPAAVCKVRWVNIRDVYRRILKKNSEPGQRPKMYKYENEVSFLKPFFKDVVVQNEDLEFDDKSIEPINEEYLDDLGARDIDSDNYEESLEKVNVEKVNLKKLNKSNTKKKKRKRVFTEEVDPMSTSPFIVASPSTSTEFDTSDPVDAFLTSIGATLKTFSPYHLNLAKSKIFAVVQEHDLQQIVQKQQHNESSSHDIKVTTSEAIYLQ